MPIRLARNNENMLANFLWGHMARNSGWPVRAKSSPLLTGSSETDTSVLIAARNLILSAINEVGKGL